MNKEITIMQTFHDNLELVYDADKCQASLVFSTDMSNTVVNLFWCASDREQNLELYEELYAAIGEMVAQMKGHEDV